MKFSKSDLLVTSIVFILSAILLFLFWNDLNRTVSLHSEEALGTIIYRKRTATHRSPSSLNWERLSNNSPVFNQDIIRTSDYSQAVIYFDDESNLELFENTMLKLDFKNTDLSVMEFHEGRISLTGGEGKIVRAGNRDVLFSNDSRVSFSGRKNEIAIEVDRGSATVVDKKGREDILTGSSEYIINTVTDEVRTIQYAVDLLEPIQNARLLSVTGDTPEISFHWKSDKQAEGLLLEISSQEDFKDPLTYSLIENSLNLELESGIWYWRVRTEEDILSSVSRFSLDQEDYTRLIFPEDKQEFSYRKIPPAIICSWSPMANASSYLLEVSAEQNFNNPIIRYTTTLNNVTLNGLDEGFWFWRVTPALSHIVLGGLPGYEAGSIKIGKRSEMISPELFYPVNNTLYELESMDHKGLTLSWENEEEADSYELCIASDNQLNNILQSIISKEPYVLLNKKNAGVLSSEGVYFWSVRWKDIEGNTSSWCPARKLQGVNEEMAIRLSYPPDRYRIADSLIRNTRFSWKTNIPGRIQFQVASDINFSNILYEEDVQAGTLLGKDWKIGNWYWRIRTFNADNSVFLETQPRLFSIIDPLPRPGLENPNPLKSYTFREGDMQTVSWAEVEGADFYNLKIYPEGSNAAVFAKSLIQSREITLSFDDFPDGDYRIKLQGFASETAQSTRIIGYLSETHLAFHRLTAMELISPLNNPSIDGLTALRKGIVLEWTSKDIPDHSQIKLFSSKSPGKTVFVRSNPEYKTIVKRLSEGRYYWTLTGDLIGFDVSAPGKGSFTVKAIPSLPVPDTISPKEGISFGPKQLQESREILFDWEPLSGATHYELELYKSGDRNPLFSTGLIKDTQYLLTDLSLLDKGRFYWLLHGEYRNQKDELEQPGLSGEFHFSIDLPELENLNVDSGEVYFGN